MKLTIRHDDVESGCEEEIYESSEESDNEAEESGPQSVEGLVYRMDGNGWRKDVPPDHSEVQQFDFDKGPSHTLCDDALPLAYFNLLLPIEQFSLWAVFTNSYASAVMERLQHQGFKEAREWYPTVTAEIQAFVATIIWMSVIKSMQLLDFWETA